MKSLIGKYISKKPERKLLPVALHHNLIPIKTVALSFVADSLNVSFSINTVNFVVAFNLLASISRVTEATNHWIIT